MMNDSMLDYYKIVHEHRYHLANRFFSLLTQEVIGIVVIAGWAITNHGKCDGHPYVTLVLLSPIIALFWAYKIIMDKCFAQSARLCTLLESIETNVLLRDFAAMYGIKTVILESGLNIFAHDGAGRWVTRLNPLIILVFTLVVFYVLVFDFNNLMEINLEIFQL